MFKKLIKEMLYSPLDVLQLPRLVRLLSKDMFIILTYHSFGQSDGNYLVPKLQIKLFERQIRYLKDHYRLIHLESINKDAVSQGRDTRPVACITMDDGYEDNYTLLFPIIQKYQIPVTIFLCTDFIDNQRPPWTLQIREIISKARLLGMVEPLRVSVQSAVEKKAALSNMKRYLGALSPAGRFDEIRNLARQLGSSTDFSIRSLNWEQIRAMNGHLVRFGSHTVYHSNLVHASDEVIQSELRESKSRIEQMLDCPCDIFAYPDGGWNDKSAAMVRNQGYRMAVTQDRGFNDSGRCLFTLKRLHVPEFDSFTVFKSRIAPMGCLIKSRGLKCAGLAES